MTDDKKLEEALRWWETADARLPEIRNDVLPDWGHIGTLAASARAAESARDEIVRETVERCANRVEQIAALARRVGRLLGPKDLLALAADLRSLAPEQPVKE